MDYGADNEGVEERNGTPSPWEARSGAATQTLLRFYRFQVWTPDFAQLQSKNLSLSATSLTFGSQRGSLKNRKFSPVIIAQSNNILVGTSLPTSQKSQLSPHSLFQFF